ncbi:MAG: SEC-C domain-containing protein [Candidatus Krumholzibacteria bacterium]|nr:SEC-C domain-containing protein [Candidatus Krumholzibacteria bacterium]
MGRNESCWCGSGKKYKKCHYQSDRKYFANIIAATCKGPT